MNVRKRGLALLMCICMIFTLLPFSVFAEDAENGNRGGTEGTAQQSVVYGKYDNGTWKQVNGMTADSSAQNYENKDTGADVTYSKTATPVEGQNDTYNITLKIESKTSSIAPGASAVVLVIDSSGSMKNGRLENAKNVAKSFIDSYGKSGSDRYLAVVNFDTYANAFEFGRKNNKTSWLDVSNGTNRQSAKNGFDNLYAGGGTNLEQGLTKAKDLLNASTVKSIANENKFVIVLTDGAPTYYSAEKNGNFIIGYYPNGEGNSCNQDTYDATVTAATKLKSSANSVYTVCYGAQNEIIDCTNETVSYFLKTKIATSAALAYEASDGDESLKTAFEEIYKSIEKGLDSGFTVTDPMGKYVTLDESSITGNGASVKNGTITWTPTTGVVSEENGVKTYTYTLTYTVKLDTSADGFVDNKYYATNDVTTLAFKDGDENITRNFNVPGVKGTAPRYKVTYEFDGNYPDSVAVPASEQHKAGDTVTMPEITAPEGWIFNGWKYNGNAVTSVEMPAGDITIVGTFTEQKAYTVKYLLNGTDISVKDADTGTENVGESVEATAPDLAGYTFAGTDAEKNQTITVVSDASANVITFYYYKNVTVTANDDTKVYGDNNPAAFGATVTGTRDNETVVYTVGRQAGEDVGNYAITPTGNEIQGYYKVEYKNGSFTIIARPVTLTGESDTRTYTGQEIELTDIKQSGLLDGHELSGVSYSAKGTDPGEYNGVFTGNVVIKDAQDNDVTANYSVTKTPGKLTINPAYQITYQYSNTPENAPACPVDDTYYADGTTVSPLKNPGTLEGYIFSGWKINGEGDAVNSVTFDDANITLIGEWKPVEGLTCTINYWWMGDSEKPMKTKTVDNLTFGQPYSASPETFDGYTVENGDEQTITIKTTGNVINFYYYKNVVLTANSDRATYDGNTHQVKTFKAIVAADRNADIAAQLGNYISALGEGKNADEYDVLFYRGKEVIPVTDLIGRPLADIYYVTDANTGTLTITPRSVTITSGSASKTYDGTPLTNDEITITGDGFVDGEATAIATGSQTDVGHSDNTIEIIKKDGFDANNYAIELKEGTLTVEKRPYRPNPPITDKITVEITGNSDSVVYDGTEHSVKDYTVKISDSRYTEKDFTFSGKALASGVNAGTYEMGLKADQFKNTNARFTNVEFIIKADGVLTITQRPLTITAGSAEGIAPVTCDKYTVEGLATGDKVDSVKITGIQSEPGESPNVASDAVIKNAKGEDVTANYKITYVNGVLKAIEVLNKEIHFNYVIGYTDGTIRPNNDISRAEVATIFFRLLTDEAREQYTTTAGNFTDVKAGMWCNRAIATLTNMGIIKGYTDGSFQPNKSITRAELATIIARFAKLDVNTKTFSDINGHWAQKNIELAAGNGWINGYEDGTFRPNNNITRAETFAMINRVLDRQTESVSDLLPTSEMNMWSDNLNENAWYYKDVQEATNYHKCDRVGDSVYEKWTEKVPDIDWASYQI